MKINLIAAIGNNGQLGLNGQLPWPRNGDDLRWFKKMTTGSFMLAGRHTYDSIVGKIELKESRRTLACAFHGQTPSYLREQADALGHEEVFIIGGAKIYERWIPYVDRFYIAHINYNGPADTYFPETDWRSL